jgi:hypothetical protein
VIDFLRRGKECLNREGKAVMRRPESASPPNLLRDSRCINALVKSQRPAKANEVSHQGLNRVNGIDGEGSGSEAEDFGGKGS